LSDAFILTATHHPIIVYALQSCILITCLDLPNLHTLASSDAASHPMKSVTVVFDPL